MNFNFNFGPPAPPTELDELIDRATNELRSSPDWAENLEVCDAIARGGEPAIADACRALRRRLADKRPQVVLLTLTLLETCMKNCSEDFHDQVAAKDFQADIVRLATGKGEVASKTLALVEAWADAFQSEGPPQFGQTFVSLRNKGARFPPRDVGSSAPLFTPPASSATSSAPAASSAGVAAPRTPARDAGEERERPVFVQSLPEVEAEQSAEKAKNKMWSFGFLPGYSALPANDNDDDDDDEGDGGSGAQAADARGSAQRASAEAYPAQHARQPPASPAARAEVAAEAEAGQNRSSLARGSPLPDGPLAGLLPAADAASVRAGLAEVQNNAAVLRDCLSAIEPSQGGLLEGDEVVRELLATLRAAEPRVVALIEGGQVESEEIMELLFRVHADLQATFTYYDEKLAAVLAEDLGGGLDEQARAEAAAAPIDLLNPRERAAAAERGGEGGAAEQPSTDLDELAAVLIATELEAEDNEQRAAMSAQAGQAPHGGGGVPQGSQHHAQQQQAGVAAFGAQPSMPPPAPPSQHAGGVQSYPPQAWKGPAAGYGGAPQPGTGWQPTGGSQAAPLHNVPARQPPIATAHVVGGTPPAQGVPQAPSAQGEPYNPFA